MDYKIGNKTFQIDAKIMVEAYDEWWERLVEAWNQGALNDFGEMLDEGPILINPRKFAGTLRRDPAMRKELGITTAQIDKILGPEKPRTLKLIPARKK